MKLYYATFANQEEAEHAGETLIKEKLIKCMNILGSGTSLYTWQESIEKSTEVYAILKSSLPLSAIESRFSELHSYDTPCLIEFDVNSVSHAFNQWIES